MPTIGVVAHGAGVSRSAVSYTASHKRLLETLPSVRGKRPPADVRAAIVEQMRAHQTELGPATEPLASSQCEPDWCWRVPIRAASVGPLEDGLRSSGYAELVDVVSDRLRARCERSWFADSFDALTGHGLRDRAYTWTAAVYLLFAADFVHRN